MICTGIQIIMNHHKDPLLNNQGSMESVRVSGVFFLRWPSAWPQEVRAVEAWFDEYKAGLVMGLARHKLVLLDLWTCPDMFRYV